MDYQPIWIKNNFQSKLQNCLFMALIVMHGICGKFYFIIITQWLMEGFKVE